MSDTYSGQHFYGELEVRMANLDKSVDAMRESGRRKAEAEHAYRLALAQKMWELKANGLPATGMGDLARGDPDVAILKLRRDSADSDHNADRESINVQKIQVKLLGEQLAREWGR